MTRLHHTDQTRDLMAMAIEALAEWARVRGIVSPCGEVETADMPTFQAEVKTTMYLTEDETTDVRNHRLQSRGEQEIWFRSQGHFDWADRTRDNTAVLANGGEIQRRRGGTRDDGL